MKFNHPTPSPRGSVLLAGLLMSTVIAMVLVGYMHLMATQNYETRRSEVWNRGVAVMEAGVEEAMTQIHSAGLANLSANNWSLGPDGYYHKTRSVGNDGSYCQVSVQPLDPPVIFSTAYMPAPMSASNYVTRKVRVTTRKINPSGGLTARTSITFGGGGLLDSYNSCAGAYNPAIHGTNAVAICNTNTAGAINLGGGGDIYGMAVTGPGGTVTTGGKGAVGDTTWIGTYTGIQPGHSANDANIQFNTVPAPYANGLPSQKNGFYNGTNYNFVVNGNVNPTCYEFGKISLGGGQSMLILGNATLYIRADFTINGGGFIYIPPGSSLKLYMGGNLKVNGGSIVNGTGAPSNLQIYGLSTCTSISFSSTGGLVGTVDAPEANFSFSGSSDAFGNFTADSITVGGQAGVHYDECLAGPGSYVVAGWNEL